MNETTGSVTHEEAEKLFWQQIRKITIEANR